MAVDWNRPVQVNYDGKWRDAHCVAVSKTVPEFAHIVLYEEEGAVVGFLYKNDSEKLRNTPTPPTWRAWKSVAEMGDAVNGWFRRKGDASSAFRVCDLDWDLGSLVDQFEHSPTPWIEESWEPCGVRE